MPDPADPHPVADDPSGIVQQMPDQNNAPERLKNLIYRVLRDYRQIEVVDEEGDGYPLVDALTITGQDIDMGEREIANIADALAYEIARADRAAPEGQVRGANRSDGGFSALTPPPAAQEPVGRIKVPAGQTPLDDKLGHRLLDVLNEGSKARDDGTGSPYHGHSLEHSLHAAGWIMRDLRLALDVAKAAPPPACQQEAVTIAEDDILADAEAAYWADPNNDSFDRHCIRAALRALKGEA